MQCLEPQRVSSKDMINWFKQSFELINRRIIANVSAVGIFFLILFFSSQAMLASEALMTPVFLLFLFLVFTGFIFYLTLAGLVVISYCSDNSQTIHFSEIIHSFIPSQKMLLKLAIIAVSVGVCFWYISIMMNPGSSVLQSSENLIGSLGNDQIVFSYLLKTGTVFLFYVLLAMLALRSIFSLPLILFHGLSYDEAQSLSHKGMIKNIFVMTNVLGFWALCVLAASMLAPFLIFLLLPLFSCFIYVAYRQVYLGEGLNEKARVQHGALVVSRH